MGGPSSTQTKAAVFICTCQQGKPEDPSSLQRSQVLPHLLCSTGNTGDFTFDFRKLTKSSRYLSLLFLFTQCPLTGVPALALADDIGTRSATAAWTCRTRGSRNHSYSPPSPYVQVQYLNLSDTFTSHKCPHTGGTMIYCNFEIIQQLFSHFRVQTTTLVSLQINY